MLSVSTYFIHQQNTQSLIKEHINKLTSLKKALKIHIEDYFSVTGNILGSLSVSQTTIEALVQFKEAYQANDLSKIETKEALLTEHIQKFLEDVSFDVPHANPRQPVENYLPESQQARSLQEMFIVNNPFDRHQRYKLKDLNSELAYAQVHKKFHEYFLGELQRYELYDLFLIDKEGNIIYSVYKESDFATNLLKGAYQNSGLATVFRKAIKSSHEEIIFEDFKPYEPSLNKPAAFIATPIYSDGVKIGVLAVELSIKRLVDVMTLNNTQLEFGLGQSGESYLVGDDFYMRSDSRFVNEIKDPLVEKFLTTVGIIKVKSQAVIQALKGEVSDGLILDYRGVPVFSSYAPINVFGKKWAILVEVNEEEIYESVKQGTITLLLESATVFIIFILTLIYLFIKTIIQPMKKNEDLLAENLRLQRRALLNSETLLNEYKKAVDISAIVSKTDKRGVITYVNGEFCKISGYQENELLGQPHNIVRHPDNPKAFFKELWQTIRQRKVWKGVIKNRRKNGDIYYVNSTIVPIVDEKHELQEYISIRSDITDLILKEEKILKHTTDPVTGLANRQKLMEEINLLAENTILASVFINGLRDIKDFYDIEVASKIVKDIAAIFQEIIAGNPIQLYRVSGDEFSLLAQEKMAIADFKQIICTLIEHFDHHVLNVDDADLNISVTAGIAVGWKSRLFVNSEMALRKAIESGKSYLLFEGESEIEIQYQNNIAMTTKIKSAIKQDDILVFAQLISPNKNVGICKYECLVRMRDSNEIISPFYFLEISKKARLYSTITKIVIEKSFKYFSTVDNEFSINITLEDILNDDVVSFLKQKIRQYGVGERLVIELVESEGIEDYENVAMFISIMKSMGCRIAIDDFGTGYSNFGYLMKLNADYIKIDGSLIKNIDHDECAEMVVSLIVSFAKQMNIDVIAEFVHSESVQKKIEAMGIDFSQGYFLAEPKQLPAS